MDHPAPREAAGQDRVDRTTAILLGALTNRATAAPVFGADATRLDDVRRGPFPPHHDRAPSGTGR